MMSLLAEADSFARAVVVRLLDGSLQGALAVAFVWVVLATCRSAPPSIRAWLWWLASLKLVIALLALPAIAIPVLPSTPHDAARTAGERVVDTAALALPVETIKQLPMAVLPPAATEVADSLGWRISALLLVMALFVMWWAAVLALQGIGLVTTHRRLKALVARAVPADEHSCNETRRLAELLRLRRVPEVRLSDDITSPQVIGLRRPCVLLPAAMSSFSEDERRMMLCHELTHVRRRDLVLGWIPALAERAFFFHPLARFAAREYVLAREAACDASVLRALGIEPERYGRLLVRLGIYGGSPALTAPGASSSVSLLRRRLVMLHAGSAPSGWRGRLWVAGIALTVALVPIHLTARDVPDGSVKPVLPAAHAVRATVAVVIPALTGQPIFADQASPRLVAGARFGAKSSKEQSQPAPASGTDQGAEPARQVEETRALLLAQRDAAAAAVRALQADRQEVVRRLAGQQAAGGDAETLRTLEREMGRQEANLATLVARLSEVEAAQRAQADGDLERKVAAAHSQEQLRRLVAQLRQIDQQNSKEQLGRDLETLSYSLKQVERAQATITAPTQLDESRKRLEQLAARQGELARAAAEIQRSLAMKYTAKHPERQALERQIYMMQQQSKALADARGHLEQQRQHLDEAQRQLAEAERRLREVLKAMPEPAAK
jgi:beta-lactamase regulating signal transducer with metallopeptidase domain